MIKINFEEKVDKRYRVLCLGAHSDDIEIGCGGTILSLIARYQPIEFWWIVFSSNRHREQEAFESANLFLKSVQEKQIIIKNFRDGFLPFQAIELKEFFEEVKASFTPDIIFTHHREDRHQDHRILSDLTWSTFRDHFILEYEIPKYDGDLGIPNFFVHLEAATCQRKVQHIFDSFKTQQDKHWFSEDLFLALSRIRGIESRAPEKYAEAFYCRKIIG